MNKIKITERLGSANYQRAELWIDNSPDGFGNIYMLCQVATGKFCAVSLSDGNRYRNPMASAQAAVKDLEFLGHGKLTIEY